MLRLVAFMILNWVCVFEHMDYLNTHLCLHSCYEAITFAFFEDYLFICSVSFCDLFVYLYEWDK